MLVGGNSGDPFAAEKTKRPQEGTGGAPMAGPPSAQKEALITPLREYVARTLGVEEAAVTIRFLATPEVFPKETLLAAISHISPGKPVGRVLFQVGSVKVAAEVEAFKEMVVASRFLRRNQVLAEADVMVSPVRLVWPDARFLEDADLVVGKRLTRPISSRSPILDDVLADPYVVRQGARVTILYLKGPLNILSVGIAKDDGPVGGRIRVSNADTKKELWGRIVDAETVQVGP